MKTHFFVAVLVAAPIITPSAQADEDKAACYDAAEKGQTLRAAHKLIEAREQFRLCAAPTCPTSVQSDCIGWVAEVERGVPTVVLSAKDATGNDVLDVTVSVDGAPLVTKLDGASLPLNPGPHIFRFQWSDGTSRERQVLVKEGEKDVVVAVSLALPGGGPVVTLPPVVPAPLLTQQSPVASGGPPWHTIGWIAGGVGVAGLILGGVSTAITISDKNAAGCNAATKTCSNYGSLTSAQGVAPAAGAGFIAGGALVVVGASLILFTRTPKEGRSNASAATIRVKPMAGARVGGALFEGVW